MNVSKKISIFLVACLLLTGCGTTSVQESKPTVPVITQDELITKETSADATSISLSDDGITVNGEAISTDDTAAVYAANDIVFYLEGQDFTYGEGEKEDAHSQAEANAHTVVHITQPGEYILSGTLSAGQIAVDLGEEAKEDPNAVVTLLLDGADVTCTVAPAVIFYNVYECGVADEEGATMEVDTTTAGANVILADGSENNIKGSYVARIYKSVELNEAGTEIVDSEKLHKYDGAFYSKMSLNIYGEKSGDGVLNIYAENEGLDSELHLTQFSGNIYIESGNDGINTNADNVSVTHILGGTLNVVITGSTGEGDGIDSNGWLVIDGGKVTASACGFSADAGVDADKGVYIRGGQVAASGNMFDRVETEQTCAVFTFAQRQTGGEIITLKTEANSPVVSYTPANDFQYLVVSAPNLTPGNYTLWQGENQLSGSKMEMQMGGGMQGGERPELPEGMEMPEGGFPEMPEGMEPPEGNRPKPPEGMGKPDGMFPAQGERPEGNPGQQPGKMGGGPGMEQTDAQKVSNIFVITKGNNSFQIAG